MSGLASRQRAARKFRSNAERMLAREDAGIAFDFTDESFQGSNDRWGSVFVKDNVTLANNFHGSPFDLLTYTSPSAKMTLGPRGILQFRPHNLLLRSQELNNVAWAQTNCTITANSIAAPDGTITAELYTRTSGGTGDGRIRYTTSQLASTPYMFFVHAKAGNTNFIRLRNIAAGGSTATDCVWYNLGTGTVGTTGSNISSTFITPVGDGWYRCGFVATTTSSVTGVNFVDISTATSDGEVTAGTAGETAYFWGAQLALAPSPAVYVPTTSAARYGLPYEWDTSGKLRGLLVEEARTNLCLRSNDLTNASWTKSNMTTSLTATGPDGVANSATICTATAGNATALQAITSGSAARVTSVWLKRRTGTGNIDLTQDNGSTWTTQTLTSSWQRFELASVTSTNPTVGIRIVTSGDEVDVYGFQHETGTFPSSYIPTVAASVTRAADDVSLALASFPYLATAHTLFVEATAYNATSANSGGVSPSPVSLTESSGGEAVRIFRRASTNTAWVRIQDGGAEVASFEPETWSNGQRRKVAVAVQANDAIAATNGVLGTQDTSVTMPTPTVLRIGNANGTSTSGWWGGHIQSIMYLPRRMPDADLRELTRAA